MGRTVSYDRLAAMTQDGLLAANPKVNRDGLVYHATATGLARAELNLPVAIVSDALFNHDLRATDVVTSLERRGVDCLTEREMRGYEREVEDARYLFDIDDRTRGRRGRHLADVACEIPDADRFFVIEVELVPKTARRWRDILDGFRFRLDVNGFGGVLYLCSENARPNNLRRIADEVGLGDRLVVLPIEADPLDGLNDLVDAAAKNT